MSLALRSYPQVGGGPIPLAASLVAFLDEVLDEGSRTQAGTVGRRRPPQPLPRGAAVALVWWRAPSSLRRDAIRPRPRVLQAREGRAAAVHSVLADMLSYSSRNITHYSTNVQRNEFLQTQRSELNGGHSAEFTPSNSTESPC